MIRIPSNALFPIMGTTYDISDFATISLDKDYLAKKKIINTADHIQYQESLRKKHKAQWLTGGYLECRSLYQSVLFEETENEVRDIHLGVDIWGPVDSPIFAPLDGVIHSFAYNSAHLDYGYTLILRHHYINHSFYLLYGHLSSTFFSSWQVGKKINQGVQIGSFGSKKENGGWLPHLHLQLILDMEGKKGDYPGVCSLTNLSHYKRNCPDPKTVIKKAL